MNELVLSELDMMDDDELDGLGRGGAGRRRRIARKLARLRRRRARRGGRMSRREAKLIARAGGPGIVPPGRRLTAMRRFKGPDGREYCPGVSDLIHISDEPLYDRFQFTDMNGATMVNPLPFFTQRTRQNNGVAVTNILTAGKFPYDLDIESFAVEYNPVDQNVLAGNVSTQRFYELLSRGTMELVFQGRTNYVFPISDCPAGTGIAGYVVTTENAMRSILGLQNGNTAKGRRRLPNPIAVRKDTAFAVLLHFSAADFALIVALTDPTVPIGISVKLYGPEGVPLVPAAAGGLWDPQGMSAAALPSM